MKQLKDFVEKLSAEEYRRPETLPCIRFKENLSGTRQPTQARIRCLIKPWYAIIDSTLN